MSRHSHDYARAVTGDDIISCPNRDFLPGDRVDCVGAGKYAGFLTGCRHAVDIRCLLREFLIFRHSFSALAGGQKVTQLRLGCDNDIGDTHKRIGAGRKYIELHR